ncbi:ABC transporter ATP-binding protein [Desulfuromonas sp. DDH964]|nr:ABC transporter ATP-binding protein [Desulfuromonas sp. DDH964]
MVTPLLTAQALELTYPGAQRPALNGLDLTVGEGEIFGLLGPNGAGKTTTISILCTQLRPSAGSVQLAGIDLLAHPGQIKALIGLVPQDIALYPALSARENLNFFGRLYGLGGELLRQRIDEALELVGLVEAADRRVGTYSGGMKRRVNLAIGVLHRPRLLFLDEPTVGIDAQSRNLILANLQRLRGEGMTMVYTTHYMEEAEAICDRVTVVDQGRVIAEGRPAALVAAAPDVSDLGELFLQLTGRQLRD